MFLLMFFGTGIPYSFGVVLTFMVDPHATPYTALYSEAAWVGSLQMICTLMFTCLGSQAPPPHAT